jgi:RHS repeat-associated protein
MKSKKLNEKQDESNLILFCLEQENTKRDSRVSNEQTSMTDVYFDDVKISYTPSAIIQGNEYYPFGLQTANSWTRDGNIANNFLANGGTELNPTSGVYDLEFRNYDPVLGRLNQVDPMSDKYSSLSVYHFAFNNPTGSTDPSGADPSNEYYPSYMSYQEANSYLRYMQQQYGRIRLQEMVPFMGGSPNNVTHTNTSVGSGNVWTITIDWDQVPEGVHIFDAQNGTTASFSTEEFGSYSSDFQHQLLGLNKEGYVSGYNGGARLWGNDRGTFFCSDCRGLSYRASYSPTIWEDLKAIGSIFVHGLQGAADVAGVVDPTGIVDGANGLVYTVRGDYFNAGISFAGLLPYAGDLAKIGRWGKVIKQTSTKTDYLFANRNDAMNWARKQLGHNTENLYDATGKWIGWVIQKAVSTGDMVTGVKVWDHQLSPI